MTNPQDPRPAGDPGTAGDNGADRPPLTDADRDAAVASLRRAAEDGRLDPLLLDDRIARVRSAATRAEVELAASDLRPAAARPWPAATRWVGQPGRRPDDPLVLGALMSDERRVGAWQVPPYLRAVAGLGSVRLNFVGAVPLEPVIELELTAGMGSVLLIVPDGWGVDLTRVRRGLGSVRSELPERPAPGGPLLIVRGATLLGEVRVRRPRPRDIRRAVRAGARLDTGRR